MEQIKEFIAEAIRLPQVWIYMIALVIVGWNLPAVRKGLNKDTDSSNKQKDNNKLRTQTAFTDNLKRDLKE